MKRKKTWAQGPSSSSVTILDFFEAKTLSTQSKKRTGTGKGKAKADPQQARAGTSVSTSFNPIESEIIVISDSDDADSVETINPSVSSKRRKLCPSPQVAFEGTPGELLQDSVKAEEPVLDNGISFGAPILLQGDSIENPLACSPSHAPDDTSAQATTMEQLEHRLSSSTMDFNLNAQSLDIDSTFGDWGTGDDEMDCRVTPAGPEEAPSTSKCGDIEPDLDFEAFLKPEPGTLQQEEVGQNTLDEPTDNGKPSAFSFLMTSHKEHEAWKSADKPSNTASRSSTHFTRRPAPFYKILQGMPIAVDAFNYGAIPGIAAYFLTHAHSDHYTSLSKSWSHGAIYCSQATANLIMHMLSVDPKWVRPLPMDEATEVPGTGGVKVTLIEANHCPGSCLFLFEGKQTVNAGDKGVGYKSAFVGSERVFRYLHCGDFRASPAHVLHPAVKGKQIDHVYLDTTYLDPKYTFPPQPLVIAACADLAQKLAAGEPTKKTGTIASWVSAVKGKGKEETKLPLFVVGTYSIGKERIVKAVARALNSKIYCDKRKTALLKCQADPELHAMLTPNPAHAVVHVVPISMITSDKLKCYLDRFTGQYSKIVGLRPTGWTYVQPPGTDQPPSVNTILTRIFQKSYTCEDLKPNGKSPPGVQIYPVPYSEHSSFYELTCFAMSFDWKKMIATVNVGNEKSRAKMAKWVSKWEAERRRRGRVEIVEHRHAEYW